MKLLSVFHLAVLTIVLCDLMVLSSVEAGRGRRKLKKKQCVYKRKGVSRECNLDTGNMEVTFRLKSSRQGFGCPLTKSRYVRCPGCRYPKKSLQFGECVNGQMSLVVALGPGSMSDCPPTRVISRKCGKGRKKGRGKKKRRGGCVYTNQEWSPCNEVTKTRQRVKVFVSGDPKLCQPKKIVTKRCRKECRYIKGEWSECDNVTNTKNRTMDPKPGSLPTCESKVQTKPCFVWAGGRRGKPTKCRYRSGEWGQCDERTNTMTQEMILRNGDPNLCKRIVKLTRKCKLTCKFRKGDWSKCDKMTRLMTRVDTLSNGDPSKCEPKREITKKCRKSKCKYTLGPWSDCDPDTKSRTRMKTLVAGGPEKCVAEIPIQKSCIRKDGEARCFFGSWGEYGPCTNGVMTKQRSLLQGGVECERKAAKTKACDN